jgi:photosystem II stability/assembly factor-like uncharacterized protein
MTNIILVWISILSISQHNKYDKFINPLANNSIQLTERLGATYRKDDYSSNFTLLRTSDSLFLPGKIKSENPNLLTTTQRWTCIGPWCGNIISLVISPYYQTDSTLFAGSHGAVYKSTDCGRQWTLKCNGILENDMCRLAIAKKPNSIVLFASIWGGNLYRSDNGGDIWYPCSNNLPDNRISAIAPSPNFAQDSLVFIGTGGWAYQGSVYKSVDGGRTWQNLGSPLQGKNITDVSISPHFDQDSVIFVGTEYDGVYRSFNGGHIWTQLNNGLSALSINQIDISPTYAIDSTIFLTECDNDEAVYRSQNGGRNWQRVLSTFASDVKISPNFFNDREVFAGSYDSNLYKSIDGGSTWTNLGGPHFNIWVIDISPNYIVDSTLSTGHGNAGGIFYSHDRGVSWESRCHGISALEVISICVSPYFTQSPIVFACPDYGAGPYRTTDGGNTWETVNTGLFNTRGYSFSPSPNMPSDSTIFYAVWYDGVYRTENLGNLWTLCSNGFPPVGYRYVREVSCSPSYQQDSIVFACLLDSTARRSYNAACSWQSCPGGTSVTNNEDIVFSPTFITDHTIFMTKYPNILIMSTNGGNSWQRRNAGLFGFLYELAISSNFPNDSTLIAVNWDGAVFRSTNAGLSWQQIFTYPDYVYYAEFSPRFATDHTVFLGGAAGVYISTNGGNSWQPWNEGFSVAPLVVELACSRSEDSTYYLFAGTYGQGVWVREYSGIGISENQIISRNQIPPLKIYPNPFSQSATLKTAGIDKMSLFNVSGHKVSELKKGTFGENLKSGVYFIVIDGHKVLKVVKSH